MNRRGRASVVVLLGGLLCPICPTGMRLNAGSKMSSWEDRKAEPGPDSPQHGFDFEFGTWKVFIRRLEHPLAGSNSWIEYSGTASVRKVWDGRANLVELEVGNLSQKIEGLSLRLFNPQSGQWRIYWANSKNGSFDSPVVGQFQAGVGEFYGQGEFEDRSIFTRFVFSEITAQSFHGVQSFSSDGGKTWETNWIETFTRTSSEAPEGVIGTDERQRDFDFEIGDWKTHLTRRLHPLTGSTTWVNLEGISAVRAIWNGRANLVELDVDDPAGNHVEGLSLRLYNPEARQWSLNFASSRVGKLGTPTIGEFKNGRGEFYDQEEFNGRTILVRNIWADMTENSCHFVQAFSNDGGKTWEDNWDALDTRTKRAPGSAP